MEGIEAAGEVAGAAGEAVDAGVGLQALGLVREARRHASGGNPAAALRLLLGAVAAVPALLEAVEEEMGAALVAHCAELQQQPSPNGTGPNAAAAHDSTSPGATVRWLCGQCTESLPASKHLWFARGTVEYEAGRCTEALASFARCVRLDPAFARGVEALENLKSLAVDRWHFRMLNDASRNSRYGEAIGRCVRRLQAESPGRELAVLDIGAGTGLLSMMAVRAGARVAYACEMNSVLADVADCCVHRNGMPGRVRVLCKHSTALTVRPLKAPTAGPAQAPTAYDLPDGRVDLVVTELVDSGLLGEHILPALRHAVRHCLRPGGLVIPRCAGVYITLIESLDIRRRCQELHPNGGASPRGVPAEAYTCEPLSALEHRALTAPRLALSIDFLHDPPAEPAPVSLAVVRPGRVDAIAVWWDMALDDCLPSSPSQPLEPPRNVVSSRPGQECCAWDQALFFVPPTAAGPRVVAAGQPAVVLQVGYTDSQLTFDFAPENDPAAPGSRHPRTTPATAASADPPTAGSAPTTATVPLAESDLARLNDHALRETLRGALREAGRSHGRVLAVLGGWSPVPFVLNDLDLGDRAVVLVPDGCTREALSGRLPGMRIVSELAALDGEAQPRGGPPEGRAPPALLLELVEPSGLLDVGVVARALRLLPAANPPPPTRCLPATCRVVVALAALPLLGLQNRVEERATCGLDLSDLNSFGVTKFRELDLGHEAGCVFLCSPTTALTLTPSRLARDMDRRQHLSLHPTAAGRADCLAFWFCLDMGAGGTISTGPKDGPHHWRQACVVLDPPLDLAPARPVALEAWCCPVRGVSFRVLGP